MDLVSPKDMRDLMDGIAQATRETAEFEQSKAEAGSVTEILKNLDVPAALQHMDQLFALKDLATSGKSGDELYAQVKALITQIPGLKSLADLGAAFKCRDINDQL